MKKTALSKFDSFVKTLGIITCDANKQGVTKRGTSFSWLFTRTTKFCAGLFIAPLVMTLAGSAHGKSIGKDQVNIRSQPSLNSDIIFTLPLGYPIEIEKEADNWVHFRDWQNNTGWVYKPLVSPIKTAVILVDKANVRSAASQKASVVANAELGEIYTILTKEGNWVKLGYYHGGSTLGWVRDDLVFGD